MLRTFAGGRLFGSQTGLGAPRILALHGWGRTRRDFDGVVAQVGEDPLPALALDLPGFGASPVPTGVWGADEYAEAVGDVLGELESPVVILGHSFGGRVALHLANQHPASVGALILTGVPFLHPAGRRTRVAPAYKVIRRLHRMKIVSAESMEAARQRYGSADYKAAQGIMRQVHVRSVNETYEAQLDAVQCPVHMIWGADDTATPVEVAERALARVARGDLQVYPGVGHLTPLLIPAVLRAAVVSCLKLIGTIVCALALVPAAARWLRVAQREHYLPGSTTRFAWRWWSSRPLALPMALLALAAAGVAFVSPLVSLATAAVVIVGPPHLGVRGRTSPLAFTRRLRLLAGVWLVLQAVVIVIGILVHRAAPVAALGACAVPLLVDVACATLSPVERRLVRPYVISARARLQQVSPIVVAITGSFGKTSTKQHVAHLVGGSRTVVASPASFNNRAGLARAVNEQLTPGTDVFVAEMGTYGKGEIADLSRWCPPAIAVITAIGPVHLERFKTEDAIVVAKSEIAETAHTVVLNVDDARLAVLADQLTAKGTKRVVRCSAVDTMADVCVIADGDAVSISVYAAGEAIGTGLALPSSVQLTNLACALAVAFVLGVPHEAALARVASIPSVANRLASAAAPSGVWVIDDTFNSNPSGARVALAELARRGSGGRRAVVTPGMVELGPRQFEENRLFAQAAEGVATDLVIVGETNRAALRSGSVTLQPHLFRTREEAVAWVRTTLGPGDAVLYENDLPDHYR